MEAATLSSPQRKFETVPVQKSLSLPSYARAGGEGIDHRIIFAALEQREKVRRKSRIFTREKSARQNIFCLPISTGAKCRETSFSSDTSCSSLEYQKPKAITKPKKDETKSSKNESTTANELSSAKTSQTETKSNSSHKDVATRNVVEGDKEFPKNSLKVVNDIRKDHRSPSNTLRPNVNSSDSMERSSRSSNDSLSRKERLVAIKAKVEAAREKYGDTSSEDENHSAITRYNSDGVIHRTVREVKSRSYRMEKRLRRRSQDEYGLKKINRKNNLSLCLNSIDDGIKLDLDRQLNMFGDHPNLECKTDFCPSPNFLEFTKKNYFSDFPSKENMSRIVQARIKQIEEEERKRRNSSDFRDKTKISSRQSPQNIENSSPFSTQRRNVYSNQNALGSLDMEKNSCNTDVLQCSSPVGRAPTPPPRSPKSMTFINKAYMQHQNSYLNHDSRSLERKPFFQPNIPVNKPLDKLNSKVEVTSNNSKIVTDIFDCTAEKRKMKELFNSRRKTCGYFDYVENFAFKDINPPPEKTSPKCITTTSTASTSQNSPKVNDTKGYFSSSETPCALSEDPKRRLWRSRWEETEKRHEFMFNSLESKKKVISPWMKWSGPKNELCLCHVLSGDKSVCTCSHSSKGTSDKTCMNHPIYGKLENSSQFTNLKEFESHQSCSRLSKSEINIAYSETPKSKIQNLESEDLFVNLQPVESKSAKEKIENNDLDEKMSATANLDSAMEELESVYRSLKFSSDNLSEKNSTSNLSLNDLNAKPSQEDIFNNNINTDLKYKLSSVKENNLNFYNKPTSVKLMGDKNHLDFLKSSVYSPPVESVIACKSADSENLCIDELFNDLTRQLDIEQKLLKESRETRNENRPQDLPTQKCDKNDGKRMTPLESIVSIRKELYDNLQKSSQAQIRPYNSVSKGFDNTQNSALETAKKRYKAVRSLSENISYLMATTKVNSVGCRRVSPDKTEPSSSSMETSATEKSSPKTYEHAVLEPLKIETKREVSTSQPVIPKRTFVPERLKKHGNEEIRQIRVSMDSNVTELKPVPVKAFTEYPRLSTAVCRPQTPNKGETATRLSPAQNVSKETIDVLDESGLEKLLNTLLNDVPDTKQSSLLLSKDEPPATPPPATSAGEMRVLQHLDILRLKPIPS